MFENNKKYSKLIPQKTGVTTEIEKYFTLEKARKYTKQQIRKLKNSR